MSAEIVARFYDNDKKNFEGFHEDVVLKDDQRFSVECILVDDETIYPLVLEEAKNYAGLSGNTEFTQNTPIELKS